MEPQWWLTSGFHVISASTTTGFQLVNLDSISNGAKTILIIVMLIGGMAYSTAGGIKFDRLVLAVKSLSKWMNQINSERTKRFFSQPILSPSHTPSFLPRINNTNLINNNAHSNKNLRL